MRYVVEWPSAPGLKGDLERVAKGLCLGRSVTDPDGSLILDRVTSTLMAFRCFLMLVIREDFWLFVNRVYDI